MVTFYTFLILPRKSCSKLSGKIESCLQKKVFWLKKRANSISPVTFDYIGKVFLLYRLLLTFHHWRCCSNNYAKRVLILDTHSHTYSAIHFRRRERIAFWHHQVTLVLLKRGEQWNFEISIATLYPTHTLQQK